MYKLVFLYHKIICFSLYRTNNKQYLNETFEEEEEEEEEVEGV